MPFPCDKCGLCCKYASADLLTRTGLPVRPEGYGCGNLKEDNTCAIYETRPEICRVDKMYEHFKEELEWDKYVQLNVDICNELKKFEGEMK